MTWIGTICIAKTATNSESRNGNFIHAKAYAAIVAMLIGMITAGMVITIVLTKYVARSVSPPRQHLVVVAEA